MYEGTPAKVSVQHMASLMVWCLVILSCTPSHAVRECQQRHHNSRCGNADAEAQVQSDCHSDCVVSDCSLTQTQTVSARSQSMLWGAVAARNWAVLWESANCNSTWARADKLPGWTPNTCFFSSNWSGSGGEAWSSCCVASTSQRMYSRGRRLATHRICVWRFNVLAADVKKAGSVSKCIVRVWFSDHTVVLKASLQPLDLANSRLGCELRGQTSTTIGALKDMRNSSRASLLCSRASLLLLLLIYYYYTPQLVVSVAQLVARRTHDRKVVGSIPTNAVCFTVVR